MLKSWMNGILKYINLKVLKNRNFSDNADLLSQKPLFNVQSSREHLKLWFEAIDKLQTLTQVVKQGLGVTSKNDIDLKICSIQTQLFHIDRSLIQFREQLFNLQYRINQYAQDEKFFNEEKYLRVCQAAQRGFVTILSITEMIQTKGILKVYANQGFISLVNALELDTSELISQLRALNQFVQHKETLNELLEFENSLLESFLSKSHTQNVTIQSLSNRFDYEILAKHKSDLLFENANKIPDVNNKEFMLQLIEIYQGLKQCYVVTRKSIINDTLDIMTDEIDALIKIFSDQALEDTQAINHLHKIYNGVESLRFSTNRDSKCSRNLFDKAKLARKQFRQACLHSDIGKQFLKQISVKRIKFLR